MRPASYHPWQSWLGPRYPQSDAQAIVELMDQQRAAIDRALAVATGAATAAAESVRGTAVTQKAARIKAAQARVIAISKIPAQRPDPRLSNPMMR